MRLQLRPMMFMTLSCSGCGRFLSKPKDAATEEDISEDIARAADPNTVYRMEEGTTTHICKKCCRPFKRKKKVPSEQPANPYIEVSAVDLLKMLDEERGKFTESNKEIMQLMVDELVTRRIYGRVSGINMTALEMVECYGAYWFEWREPLNCPACSADWRDLEHGAPFKREIGISDGDTVYKWKCPDCGHQFPRFNFEWK